MSKRRKNEGELRSGDLDLPKDFPESQTSYILRKAVERMKTMTVEEHEEILVKAGLASEAVTKRVMEARNAIMKNTYKMVVGDWSGDGHSQSDEVHFKTNKTENELMEAYKKAVEVIGLTFDNFDHRAKQFKQILHDYEDNKICKEDVIKLVEAGVDRKVIVCDGNEDDSVWYFHDPDSVVQLFLEMVKTQLPDLKYKIIDDKTPCINGYKNRLQFGYGIYSM